MDGEWPPMELFRSEEMKLVQLIMPAESAHETVMYLGDLGLLQFKDLNPDKSPFQRTYANQVKRCGEMARRLHFLRDQIDKAGISIGSRPTRRGDVDLDELEGKLAELEVELLEINANCERLERTHSELTEFKLVLQKSGTFFSLKQSKMGSDQRELNDLSTADEESVDRPFLLEQMPTEPSKQARLGFITGVVAKAKAAPFELVLHRATRGNMYFKQADIEGPLKDPATGEKIDKVVFIVFFSGDWARIKVLKLCEAFGASRYPFPEEVGMQAQMMSEVSDRLRELQTTIDASFRHRDAVLTTVGCEIDQWELIVLREKAVYYTLNMFSVDVTRKCLVAEGWCPQSAKTQIQDALQRAAFDCNSQVATIFQVVETQELPPTYFKTNKFTRPFQEIVDAYGVARYQEANPGVYTIVTFPFLFAVMFGDWGHGIVMLVAVLWLIFNEKRYRNQKLGDIMGMAFGGRYVILLMSVFSIYTGLIYNEFFSVPFSIFGSSAYHCSDVNCSTAHKNGLNKTSSYTYPFGVDPSWHGTRTELPFLNSLKMKMSILIGVAQMNLGIILSYYNGKFFQNQLNIWYQFIPQIIFLNALFGYLCFLILVKWCFGSKADLYHVMIYMFLSPTDDLGENQLFWGQKFFQIILLLMAIVAVPWMLVPKPLILRQQHLKRLQGRMYGVLEASDTDSLEVESEASLSYEFEFSEVFVHQMIHTIEFVLGAVSNTASYLRLWALSLAHAELSAVFYEKVLILSWRYNSIFIRTLGVGIFIFATVGVLLLMETLSAFLHALRLHWVEFQSKFYEGDGYKFHPFSFSTLRGQDD